MNTWLSASCALLLPNPKAGAFLGPRVLRFLYCGPGFWSCEIKTTKIICSNVRCGSFTFAQTCPCNSDCACHAEMKRDCSVRGALLCRTCVPLRRLGDANEPSWRGLYLSETGNRPAMSKRSRPARAAKVDCTWPGRLHLRQLRVSRRHDVRRSARRMCLARGVVAWPDLAIR